MFGDGPRNTGGSGKEKIVTAKQYRRSVAHLYTQFASNRLSRYDQRLVDELFAHNLTIDVVRSALILGSACRLSRDPKAGPLPRVRSLYYFRPLIDEILAQPLAPRYIDYIQFRLNQLIRKTT
jgi:hypothetical protein